MAEGKSSPNETHAGIGLSFIVGIMLIIGGIFTLPVGLFGIIIGGIMLSNASKKIDKLKEKNANVK